MTLHDRLADFRAFASMIIILTFINIWQTWNLFMSDRDLIRITETLSLANIPAYNAAIKLGVIWYYKKDLQPIVQSLYDDWYAPKTNEERTTMMNSARFSKRLSFWCIVLSLIMLTTYVSLRSFKIVKYDVNAMSQDRLAIYPAYYPFDLRRTSVRVVANVAQVIAAYCGALPYSGVDTFIATLVMHACGQFKNLCRKLERLMDETSKKRKSSEIQQELAWIIKRHEHLNWIGNKIGEYFSILLFLQMLLSTVEICFQGFSFFNVILKDENGLLTFQMFFFVLYVSFVIVHMFVYCYVGDLLLVQSSSLGMSAYKSRWYNVAPSDARCLLFIMLRSTRPLCLTAGKFGIFSMEMFSSILRTAMGYLSVLLTVSSGDN
nr:odorant receptor 4-like [Nomia melanderi]